MKYSLLISLFAFLSLSFYQNETPEDFTKSNDSCLLKNIMTTSVNDTGMIDTSLIIFTYDEKNRKKKVDNHFANGGNIYVTYEYDKKGRIKKITDHYILKIDAYGYSKGDIANRNQKRFKYKKGAKYPSQVKYLLGTAWENGIKDNQLKFNGKSTFEFNEKGQLIKQRNMQPKYPDSTDEFTYDYSNNTVWEKLISHTESGDILKHTTEYRYDELMEIPFSLSSEVRFNQPDKYSHRKGNNLIYSKMVNGLNIEKVESRGKIVREYESEIIYNENGLISKLIRREIDNIDPKRIGKISTSEYEYICK